HGGWQARDFLAGNAGAAQDHGRVHGRVVAAGGWERQTMSGDPAPGKPDDYWDRAGALGYARAMFPSSDAEAHVRGRQWQAALDIAEELGVPADGHVLDLGCGD